MRRLAAVGLVLLGVAAAPALAWFTGVGSTSSEALVGTASGGFGERGPTGPTGPSGPAGPVGPAGAPGARGPTGAAGAVGPAGPAGAKGATGSAGARGATGARGPTGPSGTGSSGFLLGGTGAASSTVGTFFLGPGYAAPTTTETNLQVVVPTALSLTRLYCTATANQALAAPGISFSLRRNGVTLSGSCSLAAAPGGCPCSSSATGTWTFSAGDLLSVQVTRVASDGSRVLTWGAS